MKLPWKKETNLAHWSLLAIIIFFVLILVCISSYLIFEKKFENRFYPGISVGNITLGGMSYEEGLALLETRIENITTNGIKVNFQSNQNVSKEIALTPIVNSLGVDLSYQIIFFNPRDTLNEAMSYGRSHNIIDDILKKIQLLKGQKNIAFQYRLNDDEVLKLLQENFNEFNTPSVNASIVVEKIDKDYSFKIADEKNGDIIDYFGSLSTLKDRLANLSQEKIDLKREIAIPGIKKNEVYGIEKKALEIAELAPINLSYEKNKWTVSSELLVTWLTLSRNTTEDVVLDLDKEKIRAHLAKSIAPSIFKEPISSRFDVKNGKVTSFQVGKDGLELDIEASTNIIVNQILTNHATTTELVSLVIENEITDEKINNSGIKEIIGTGHSSYVGSPKNRIHNIKIGAAALDGLLIKPDEEFSLVKALGEIDKESGYLPELVIKGNETIPEYGGGLCQIGTTLFRTVLASGLPVTERRNHSYRVSYYEPAGTDATIYSPWPDFRFYNDTGNYVLIQARFVGANDLYFDFWGVGDGRIATSTYPTIYNIKKPEPTKIIETDKLAPGEKKCTEHSHNGADAWFDYTVTYPEKNISSSTIGVLEKSFDNIEKSDTTITSAKKRFYSHYVPWREVCLVGSGSATSSPTTNEPSASTKISTTTTE